MLDQSGVNFSVKLFVDSMPPNETAPVDAQLRVGRINRHAIEESLGMSMSWWQKLFKSAPSPAPEKRVLFLVCGPEPYVPQHLCLSNGALIDI